MAETLAQVFSCKFCEISKNNFFTEHHRATASVDNHLNWLKWFLIPHSRGIIFLSPFFDVIRMSMSTVSVLAQLDSGWNSVFAKCFPLTYDLNGFQYRVNKRHFSLGSLWAAFLHHFHHFFFFFF